MAVRGIIFDEVEEEEELFFRLPGPPEMADILRNFGGGAPCRRWDEFFEEVADDVVGVKGGGCSCCLLADEEDACLFVPIIPAAPLPPLVLGIEIFADGFGV